MVIRRIGVRSAALIWGTLNAVIGVVAGAIFAAISVATTLVPQDADVPSWLGAVFGVGALVIFPILYGVMGALAGALLAAVYNLIAGMAGGLRLEVE